MLHEAIDPEHADVLTLHPEFVPVAIAANGTLAADMCAMLERQNVPAILDDDAEGAQLYTGLNRGVPVLVPAQMHDLATVVLAQDDDEAFEEEIFDDDDEEFDDDFDDLDDLDDDYEDEDDDDDFDGDFEDDID